MKPKTRVILQNAIEQGIICGYNRAFKYTKTPDEADFITALEHAIWVEIDERFDFEDEHHAVS